MRICQFCGEIREPNQFFKDRNQCYSCVNVRRRLRNAKNPSKYTCEHCNEIFNRKNSQKFCSLKCKLLSQANIQEGCWDWKKELANSGYGKINHGGKDLLAHRVSYEIFKGDAKGFLVCHTCDNKKCINPDHLWLGTQKDNAQDAIRKGLWVGSKGRKWTEETREKMKSRPHADRRGEKHHKGKLKNEDVFEIRNMIKNGLTQTEIAKKFGVDSSVVSNIKTGKSWSHI